MMRIEETPDSPERSGAGKARDDDRNLHRRAHPSRAAASRDMPPELGFSTNRGR